MSDQVQIEITGMVITHRYGSLTSGTILRTDAAYARHLVEDCGAAKYVVAGTQQPESPKAVVKAPPKKAKKQDLAALPDGALAAAAVLSAESQAAGAESTQSNTSAE